MQKTKDVIQAVGKFSKFTRPNLNLITIAAIMFLKIRLKKTKQNNNIPDMTTTKKVRKL
jgi:hypothetical protein